MHDNSVVERTVASKAGTPNGDSQNPELKMQITKSLL
jgi:hypothetical protein